MKRRTRYGSMIVLLTLFVWLWALTVSANVLVQCPGDTNGDGISEDPNIVCRSITGGDGYTTMADGLDLYIFGFGNADGVPDNRVIADMTLKAQLPSPTIVVKQGQELYLTMTNVGMAVRPDLFDPHTVHWHGFPNAAPIFDGLPEPSPSANMGNSMTYYYNAVVPGTYFYHCHVEAAEHMQMGMVGNLWVTPKQDGTSIGGFTKFAYNDGDGTSGYDVAFPVLLTGFDSFFHIASDTVQALPFAAMFDEYPMINGRGYPDTIKPNDILNKEGFGAQKIPSLITATAGQRILLRVSNISTTHQYTFATTLGVPMKVVARGAALLRGPDGKDTSMTVNVLNVGGGQDYDVILDTSGVAPGTYFLYTTDLANLSNGNQERGGIMTEIVINPL